MTLLKLNNGKWCVIAVIAASCQSAPLMNNGVPNGAGGSAGTPGSGGAASGGAATAGSGGAPSGAGGVDAAGGMGGAGTTPQPAVTLVSAHDVDIFCGLKSGQVRCWTSASLAWVYDLTATSRSVVSAPPDLNQIAVSDSDGPGDPMLCGVDQQGDGSCWAGPGGAVGDQLLSVHVSRESTCALRLDGTVSCTGGNEGVPADRHYTQIALSENRLAALDENGNVFFPSKTFPPGVYTEVTTNDAAQVGAVRADGAVVYFPIDSPAVPVIREGSFVHLALGYGGDACALDRAGEITCWPDQGFAGPLAASDLPRGPFTAIAAATSAFCAVRTTGTIVCWGSDAMEVPPGW